MLGWQELMEVKRGDARVVHLLWPLGVGWWQC